MSFKHNFKKLNFGQIRLFFKAFLKVFLTSLYLMLVSALKMCNALMGTKQDYWIGSKLGLRSIMTNPKSKRPSFFQTLTLIYIL